MFPICVLLVVCADQSYIGRIDKSTLSQQTLMEILIQRLSNTVHFLPMSNDTNIAKWKGLTFNKSDMVTGIDWTCYDLCGTFLFQWLLQTLQHVNLFENNLTGTVLTKELPDGLLTLNLRDNTFFGPFDPTIYIIYNYIDYLYLGI